MTSSLKLYWCTTPCGSEDWFVVAHDYLEAAAYHEASEGFEENDAYAEFVAAVPAGMAVEVGSASEETVVACGGERVPFIAPGGDRAQKMRKELGVGGRAYRFGDKVYVEGDLIAQVMQEHGELLDDA
jgi:hypothetical protein